MTLRKDIQNTGCPSGLHFRFFLAGREVHSIPQLIRLLIPKSPMNCLDAIYNAETQGWFYLKKASIPTSMHMKCWLGSTGVLTNTFHHSCPSKAKNLLNIWVWSDGSAIRVVLLCRGPELHSQDLNKPFTAMCNSRNV